MAANKGFDDNPGRSVRLNYQLSLGGGFAPLLDWFTGQVIHHHELQPLPITVNQIKAALDCLLANLMNANRLKSGNCNRRVTEGLSQRACLRLRASGHKSEDHLQLLFQSGRIDACDTLGYVINILSVSGGNST